MQCLHRSAINCMCIDLQADGTILIPAAGNWGQDLSGAYPVPIMGQCEIRPLVSRSRKFKLATPLAEV